MNIKVSKPRFQIQSHTPQISPEIADVVKRPSQIAQLAPMAKLLTTLSLE